MKFYRLFAIGIFAAFAIPAAAQNVPQNQSRQDSTLTAIKVEELQRKQASLVERIKIEDAKRDQNTSGVAPETQELLNDRQDSVCLALRSQLVSVELELKELLPDKTSEAIVNQLNELMQSHRKDGQDAGRKTE